MGSQRVGHDLVTEQQQQVYLGQGIVLLFNGILKKIIWPWCAPCGVLVLWPGTGLTPPAWEAQGLNHWTTREVTVLVSFVSMPAVLTDWTGGKRQFLQYALLLLFKSSWAKTALIYKPCFLNDIIADIMKPSPEAPTLLDCNITLPTLYVIVIRFLFMEIYSASFMGSCQSHLLGLLWNGSASIITIIQHLWAEQLEDGTLGCRTQLRVSQSNVMDSSDRDGKNLLGKSQRWENLED